MLKLLYIPIIMMFWILVPKQSSACNEHSSHKKEMSCTHEQQENTEEHTSTDQAPTDKEHASPNKNCCSSDGPCCCIIPMVQHNFLLVQHLDFQFIAIENIVEYHFYNQPLSSAGFSKIFTPPKIA